MMMLSLRPLPPLSSPICPQLHANAFVTRAVQQLCGTVLILFRASRFTVEVAYVLGKAKFSVTVYTLHAPAARARSLMWRTSEARALPVAQASVVRMVVSSQRVANKAAGHALLIAVGDTTCIDTHV
jgi:hypothetical protein